MDADGKNRTRLTNGWYPSWSPDGQRIAFASDECHGMDGKNQTRTTLSMKDPNWRTRVRLSPDGQRIAVVRLHRTKTTRHHNVTGGMDADGKNQTRLTNLVSVLVARRPTHRIRQRRGYLCHRCRGTPHKRLDCVLVARRPTHRRAARAGLSMSYILNSAVVGDEIHFHANGFRFPPRTNKGGTLRTMGFA